MAWFRTNTGQLVHAVGGLARVCVGRGYVPVSDEDAATEAAHATAGVEPGAPGRCWDHTPATAPLQAAGGRVEPAGDPGVGPTRYGDGVDINDGAAPDPEDPDAVEPGGLQGCRGDYTPPTDPALASAEARYLSVVHQAHADLTAEELAEVDRVIADETPPGIRDQIAARRRTLGRER